MTDIMPITFRKLIARVLLWKEGNSFRYFKDLDRSQWLDLDENEQHQKKQLKNLLTHAYSAVPYYRKILADADVVQETGDVNLNNFNKIPVLTKENLRANFDALKSTDIHKRDHKTFSSGGSTGKPVQFIQDADYEAWRTAIKLLYDKWSSYKLGEPRIHLWGSPQDTFSSGAKQKYRMRRWLRNIRLQNAFLMTVEQMHAFVKEINDTKPTFIFSYSESLYELSKFIEQNNLHVASPRSIMTSAGMLYPHMREKIESVFGAPVFNRYGSREAGDIACECEQHQGFHVCVPTHFVEIVKSDGRPAQPGETGEIIVTPLKNYSMPLIRYRIEDRGEYTNTPCECGRSWPLLTKVTGRVSDTFVKRDGTLITLGPFDMLIDEFEWIRRYQIIQNDYEDMLFILETNDIKSDTKRMCKDSLEVVADKIRGIMGHDCRVEFKLVEKISPEASGKYRYTISNIQRDQVA